MQRGHGLDVLPLHLHASHEGGDDGACCLRRGEVPLVMDVPGFMALSACSGESLTVPCEPR